MRNDGGSFFAVGYIRVVFRVVGLAIGRTLLASTSELKSSLRRLLIYLFMINLTALLVA
jgi:hypothetical protein